MQRPARIGIACALGGFIVIATVLAPSLVGRKAFVPADLWLASVPFAFARTPEWSQFRSNTLLGDAAIMGAMPKSAFAANNQAKTCAAAIGALLRGEAPTPPKLVNTCYSLVAPGYGISVAGVYEPVDGRLADVKGAGGTSALDAPRSERALEAGYAEAWYETITADVFG